MTDSENSRSALPYDESHSDTPSRQEDELTPIESMSLEDIHFEFMALFGYTFPPLVALVVVVIGSVLNILKVFGGVAFPYLLVFAAMVIAYITRGFSCRLYNRFPATALRINRLWFRLTDSAGQISRERFADLLHRHRELLSSEG